MASALATISEKDFALMFPLLSASHSLFSSHFWLERWTAWPSPGAGGPMPCPRPGGFHINSGTASSSSVFPAGSVTESARLPGGRLPRATGNRPVALWSFSTHGHVRPAPPRLRLAANSTRRLGVDSKPIVFQESCVCLYQKPSHGLYVSVMWDPHRLLT